VTGSVVTIIGINLMPVAMNYLAGGEGAKNYGKYLIKIMNHIIRLVLLSVQLKSWVLLL
jgi:xanthine permease